jgi:hypothetical protein
MPILSATFRQLITLTGENPSTFRSDRLRGNDVAAFGGKRSVLGPSKYLVVDGLAWKIRDALSDDGVKRHFAAMIVRGFSDRWLECVARIEHRNEVMMFACAEQAEKTWWCGAGLASELPAFLASSPPPRRLTS